MAVAGTDAYCRNIVALREAQPLVAKVVDAAPIPEGVLLRDGRDGLPTFLLPSSHNRGEWFGGSSMPSVSAPATFEGRCGDGRSVVLPGMFTGLEALVLVGMLPQFSAVFVVEPSASNVKMALHLHDYSPHFSSGRIVLVVGEGEMPLDGLTTWFRDCPGYEWPVHLLTAPQWPSNLRAKFHSILEDTSVVVQDLHQRVVSDLSRQLAAHQPAPESTPRVAVVGLDTSAAALDHGERIGRALTKLGWSHRFCLPDSPQRCHRAARLRAVLDSQADFVLFVGGGAASMRAVLPDPMAVASWLAPGMEVFPTGWGGSSDRDIVFVATESQRQALSSAGVPAASIRRFPPGADEPVVAPCNELPKEISVGRGPVMVLANLPDDRPEACGVTLASHLALWHLLRKLALDHADDWPLPSGERILKRAERSSGTVLRDAKVRGHFIGLIEARILPAAQGVSVANALLSRGYAVNLWGSHWPMNSREGLSVCGGIPRSEALNQAIALAEYVVMPLATSQSLQWALDAIVAARYVACRAPAGALADDNPELSELEMHFHFYRNTSELLAHLADVDSTQPQRSIAARKIVLDNHTMAHRLSAIWKAVQGSRSVAPEPSYG